MKAKTNDLATHARDLALRFTLQPSVTGSASEAQFADWLAGELMGFDKIWTTPIPGGAHARKNLFALRKGTSNATVVLTGHFDVVPVDDYGALPAFDAEALLAATIARLKATGENPLALADFESGDFLPGRGLLDMKAGLAAGLAAINAYQGEATLLFLAVADEENGSAGARAAIPDLKQAAKEHGLDIKLVINLDAIADLGDGAAARVITYGSIGKQLLTAFVVGQETHAGYSAQGANAAYIAAELVTEFELSPQLAEIMGNERTAAPTVLYAKDLKQVYNVTTPASAFVYWNTLQYQRGPAEVLATSLEMARTALDRAEARLNRKIALITVADLLQKCAPEPLAQMAQTLSADATLDVPEKIKRLTQHAWALSGLTEPTVVIGFGSIPYPAVLMQDTKLRSLIEKAVSPLGVGSLNYFAGISDMSCFGEAAGSLDAVAANTPGWGILFEMHEPAGYPTINLGPWGRDYHHWLERLHAPYAFETLPRALLAVIEAVAR
ncbi:M20/M25/M40 family metallo-hydrolase [Aestuariivirga litoralis]|uniref:M20/M25/M40 family metallo-hydrolase n=1 Tax=Aestuariivirga litoralis TaxID=2650924 RepID=UPI0018C81285|nr:M20/M25/M40 family metallo-hydrolase [Aestuariivirga litoralis]MBG1231448.1 M20/M25/M40 family metallo-hydrolase [Aestuariivirga litoralis]